MRKQKPEKGDQGRNGRIKEARIVDWPLGKVKQGIRNQGIGIDESCVYG